MVVVAVTKNKGKDICVERYNMYKAICTLDVFKDRCDRINDTASIEEILEILIELNKKSESFKECFKAREKYTKICHGGKYDKGHEMHMRLLENASKDCVESIEKISSILENHRKMLNKAGKQMEKLKSKKFTLIKKHHQNSK